MSEFHLENNYLISPGFPVDSVFFEKKVYNLLTIFGSSKFLYENLKEEDEDYLQKVKEFERSDASELLISIAIMSRSFLETAIDSDSYYRNSSVGKISINESKEEKLEFKVSCDKIIHAKNINFDISEGISIKDGFLNPKIYLYGTYGDDTWKAVINIIDFCKIAIRCSA